MHELSVTESILEIALRHSSAAGADRVTDLYLVIGELASIVDESVQLYWELVTEGTTAAGSTLHFRRVPGRFRCGRCSHSYFSADSLLCPSCGSIDVEIVAGEEFYIEAIAIARPGEPELQAT